MDPIPFVLVGDAPGQTTGLSRIAHDLASRLYLEREALGIDLIQVGAVAWGPLPQTGVALDAGVPWPVRVFQPHEGWGARALQEAIEARWTNDRRVVIFTAAQPLDRCFEIAQWAQDYTQWGEKSAIWNYVTFDGENRNGVIGGPCAAALRCADRILAAGPYAANILCKMTHGDDIPYLPHGIDRAVFTPEMTEAERDHARVVLLGGLWAAMAPEDPMVLGCVATNHARKDLPLFFGVLRNLIDSGMKIRGWLHTDREIGEAWSVPQLAEDFEMDSRYLTVTTRLTDRELACCYASCITTIAVGRGEGFGYPIVESLACGTPCAGADYAEGASLLPLDMRVYAPAQGSLTGPYGIARPHLRVTDFYPYVTDQIQRQQQGIDVVRAAARTRTEPYDWTTLWPEWRNWFVQGLTQLRGDQS